MFSITSGAMYSVHVSDAGKRAAVVHAIDHNRVVLCRPFWNSESNYAFAKMGNSADAYSRIRAQEQCG